MVTLGLMFERQPGSFCKSQVARGDETNCNNGEIYKYRLPEISVSPFPGFQTVTPFFSFFFFKSFIYTG